MDIFKKEKILNVIEMKRAWDEIHKNAILWNFYIDEKRPLKTMTVLFYANIALLFSIFKYGFLITCQYLHLKINYDVQT